MSQTKRIMIAMLLTATPLTASIACDTAIGIRKADHIEAAQLFTSDDAPKAEIKEGAEAPDFTLRADDGREIKLSDYRGKQAVVLYFYPKDETPGCTKQACAFRDSLADYKKANIEVLGVSVDSVASHREFKKNQKLNFTLLSDEDKKVSGQYGVLSQMGYSRRVTFVIGKDGRVKKIYEKVDPALNAAEVLAFAKTL